MKSGNRSHPLPHPLIPVQTSADFCAR